MSENPDIQWALDLLTPKPEDELSVFHRYGLLAAGTFSGFLGACLNNLWRPRPIYSGIQVHITLSIAGFVGTYMFKNMYEDYYAKRDNMLKHYIMLHPEDFPPPERKKWGEVFDPWCPVR